MEGGDELVRHHPVLGMIGDALELDLFVTGKDRGIGAPGMAELIIFETGDRIGNASHCDLALPS
jgi:hypothetical protein